MTGKKSPSRPPARQFDGMLVCGVCERIMPWSAFYAPKPGRKRPDPRCKECDREIRSARRRDIRDNDPVLYAKYRERAKANYLAIRNDPVRYAKYRADDRLYSARYYRRHYDKIRLKQNLSWRKKLAAIRADPVLYAEYLEKGRQAKRRSRAAAKARAAKTPDKK